MSNLIPEVHVNKNGVPVVKHVRPWTTAGAGWASIPAPSASDFVLSNTRARVDDILDVLMRDDSRFPSGSEKQKVRDMLLPGTQAALDASKVPVQDITTALRSCLYAKDFSLLNNMAVLCDLIPNRPADFEKYCAGIQKYPHIMRDVDLSESDEMLDISTALVRVASEVSGKYRKGYHSDGSVATALNSKQLSALVAERPSDAGRIIDLLNERELPVDSEEDIDHIREMLDASPTAAIAEGVL
jgi:hypothetical protein